MADRPQLRALADALGILEGYDEALTGAFRPTSDAARQALCAAMGYPAASEAEAARARARLREEEEGRPADPVSVEEVGTPAARRVVLRLPRAAGQRVEVRLALRHEDGGREASALRARVDAAGRCTLRLPAPPTLGVSELALEVAGAGASFEVVQRRIVCPARCTPVRAKLGGRRGFGVWAHLYTVRSRRDLGVGDLGDLARLVALARREGAAFVGLNPLHALWNRDEDVSPYAPVSRLYRNLVYLDLAAVPELAEAPAARDRLEAPGTRREIERLRASHAVDYEAVDALKRTVLRPLHRAFGRLHRGRPTARGRAYTRYLAREGEPLQRFATFLALSEHRAGEDGRRVDWRRWPEALRDPASPAVRKFATAHEEAVDFHRFVQFELDRQLAAAARRGRGLPVGLYTDLALGSAADGADAWMHPGLFADGARIGAPPDDFNPDGQDWGLPPLDPRRLREDGFGFWIRLLRANFAHAGALRIDHALALRRLFWIPTGAAPRDGAYVRQPERELLAILALESRRAGALAIGEDLGTVPPGFGARLARSGVLSSRVLLFERENGRVKRAHRFTRRALLTANTHDLPPLASLWSERDLVLRREAGQIPDDEALARERVARAELREALRRRLARDGLLDANEVPPSPARWAAAVTRFLCRTPAVLVGLGLDDLVGEDEPVNLPGVPPSRHRSWVRRVDVALEALARHPVARASLDAVPAVRRARRARPRRRRRGA